MTKTGSYWLRPLSQRYKQNLEEIQEEIIEAKKNREEWLIQTYHKDYASDRYGRELNSLHKIKELLELGADVATGTGGIYVNDKYVVAYQQNKWRVDGKGKWYWYKNLEDFMERYVNTKAGLNEYKYNKKKKIEEEESVLNG